MEKEVAEATLQVYFQPNYRVLFNRFIVFFIIKCKLNVIANQTFMIIIMMMVCVHFMGTTMKRFLERPKRG